MKFLTIMPFEPSDVPFMAEEYRRMAKSAGLSVLLPSMTLHPEGKDPYEKADLFIGAYAELKRQLEGSGIRLGVLLQTLIGHGWSSASPCGAGFQTTVNHSGGTRGRMCPLDENFLRYCRCVVSSLAKLAPETFLLDDDTRLIDNSLLECFCPLHRAKFSKRCSQEELIRLVTSAKPGDAILAEFEKVRRDSLEAFCRNIRAAIDSVNPAIPCGLSGAGREQVMFERMALAAAGNTEPFVRVGNALYFEEAAKEQFPRRFWQTAVQKKGCGKVRTVLDESDTYPQDLYSKSASGMHSHITGAILGGLTGGKLWISNFINPKAGRPNASFEAVMRENSGFYSELERTVAETQWLGPASPLPNLEKNFNPLEYPDYFTCPEWESDVIGRLGIPFRFAETDDPSAECFMVTGKLAENLTDPELKNLAAHNLFLDSTAAAELARRGIRLGFELGPCPHFSYEEDPESGEKMRLLYSPEFRLPHAPDGRADIYSVLERIPFTGSPETETVAPGCIGVKAENGRKYVVWTGIPEGCYTVSPERRRWLLKIFRRLAELPVSCANEQDVFFRAGKCRGGAILCALVNLNYDPIPEVTLECAFRPESAEELLPSGAWRKIRFRFRDGLLSTGVPCGAYRPVVFRLNPAEK